MTPVRVIWKLADQLVNAMSIQLDVKPAALVKRYKCHCIYRTSNKRLDMKLLGLLNAG
jgi:hypothetical protein